MRSVTSFIQRPVSCRSWITADRCRLTTSTCVRFTRLPRCVIRHLQLAGLAVVLSAPGCAHTCWEQAARRYGVSVALLHAIGRVEPGLNPHALNASHARRTGTYDIGLMQVNSTHLRRLARYGIHEHDLYQPCTNIHVGAWLLAESFARHGVTWQGVGAYNAGCSRLKGSACQNARAKYAWLVYRQLMTRQIALPDPTTTTMSRLTSFPHRSRPLVSSVQVTR